jgi:hypothetical protein
LCSCPSTSHPRHRVLSDQFSFSSSFLFSGTQLFYVYTSVPQNDVRTVQLSMATITPTSTLTTSTSRGHHLHVVLACFYSSHTIRLITTLQLRDVSSLDSTFGLFSSLAVCGASVVTVGDIRVYLIDYILYIIDCQICPNIFDMINIIYCGLSYVSRAVLPLKAIILYIYRPRATIQYNQQFIRNLFLNR